MNFTSIIYGLAQKRGNGASPIASPFLTGSYNSFQNNLSWNTGTQSTTYVLQRSTGSNYNDAFTVYQSSGSAYTDTVQLNNTYYYRVAAINGGVTGSWLNYSINTLPSDGTTGTGSYFFGDSITYGVGTSGGNFPQGRWTALLSTSQSWAENNRGISGTTVTSQSCLVSLVLSTIPAKTNAMNYLFISFGVNDCFLDPGPFSTGSVSTSSYQSSLSTAISYSIANGWPANRIIVNSLFYTTFNGNSPSYCSASFQTDEVRKRQFLNCAKSSSLQYGTNFIDEFNFMSGSGGGSILADQIHPNDAGHAIIANYIYTLINH